MGARIKEAVLSPSNAEALSSRRDTTASWWTKIQIAKSARHRHRGRNVANLTFLLRPFFFFCERGVLQFCAGMYRG